MAINKTYSVTLDMTVSVTKEVQAESFEEALELGRAIKVPDVIELKGVDWFDDFSIKVSGVFEQ